MLAVLNVASLLISAAAVSNRGSFLGASRSGASLDSEASLAFVVRLEFVSASAAPLPKGYPLPKVVWGIETNGNPTYETIVEAQLATWAQDLPREELVIVGGKFDDASVDANWAATVPPNKCQDTKNHLNCKEAVLLDRGSQRVKALDADWLMVGQEDKYIWIGAVQQALARLDASKPQVIGSFGCGKSWKHVKESQNGTVPQPAGWVEPRMTCKAVFEQGGLCGGPTYYVSRGALNLLRRENQTSDEFVAEYLAGAKGRGGESDLFSSCLFYDRGIPQSAFQRTSGDFANLPNSERLNDVGNQLKSGKVLAAHLSGNKEKIPSLLYSLAKMGFH